jgi:hypothetical protein
MPRKSSKRSNKGKKTRKQTTKKQKLYVMKGCSNKSKSCKNKKSFLSSTNCKCDKQCKGSCYLNRSNNKRFKGGSGCGSCGCPIAPLSVKQMNQFGGQNYLPNNVPLSTVPLATAPLNYKPILGTSQNGGSCSSCGQPQSGGNFFKPASPIPGPFVGSSWDYNKWPGVNGISSDNNYLKSYANTISNDPQMQMSMSDAGYKTLNSMVGGYTYGKKSNSINSSPKSMTKSMTKSMKAGGLIPQDLVNLGSDFTFNLKSAYNALNGYKAPIDPLPYKDQLSNTLK